MLVYSYQSIFFKHTVCPDVLSFKVLFYPDFCSTINFCVTSKRNTRHSAVDLWEQNKRPCPGQRDDTPQASDQCETKEQNIHSTQETKMLKKKKTSDRLRRMTETNQNVKCLFCGILEFLCIFSSFSVECSCLTFETFIRFLYVLMLLKWGWGWPAPLISVLLYSFATVKSIKTLDQLVCSCVRW